MKIKRKVEMTHEEYAKYMIDKFGIAGYERELIDNNIFDAPMEFEQTFTLNPMRKDDDPVIKRGFKGVVIEVEEEITEDTVLSTIIECEEDDTLWVFKEITLKEMHESKCLKETTKYYKDEDEKMYLIWRDGKLVE